ncbi:MAG: DUF1311 domain-containing protein [Alcaligenaceae bacterium]|nr:DUF1311 domain-containing protein [Alcaligenaceae bacterium]
MSLNAILISSIITSSVLSIANAQTVSSETTCAESAQTMSALRDCAYSASSSSHEKLSVVIQEIERLYEDKPEFLVAFRESQQAWEKFYDAQLRMMFPHMDTPSSYGSIFGYCINTERSGLVEQRIRQLQQWVDGYEEGFVCSGSIRIVDQ